MKSLHLPIGPCQGILETASAADAEKQWTKSFRVQNTAVYYCCNATLHKNDLLISVCDPLKDHTLIQSTIQVQLRISCINIDIPTECLWLKSEENWVEFHILSDNLTPPNERWCRDGLFDQNWCFYVEQRSRYGTLDMVQNPCKCLSFLDSTLQNHKHFAVSWQL